MKKNQNSSPDDLESFFKEKLANGRMEPSPGLWDEIEAELEAEKKPSLLFPGLGVLILLALGISVGIYFFGSKTKDAKKDRILAEQRARKNSTVEKTQSPDNISASETNVNAASQNEENVKTPAVSIPVENSGKELNNQKTETQKNDKTIYSGVNSLSQNNPVSSVRQEDESSSSKPVEPSVSEISPTKIPVKTENATSTSSKEKSSTSSKAFPVLGSGTAKSKLPEEKSSTVDDNSKTDNSTASLGNISADNKDSKTESTEAQTVQGTNQSSPEAKPAEESIQKTADPVANSAIKKDSIPPEESYGKLALSVGIGFNQMLSPSYSNVSGNAQDNWLTSFGDECKFQYRPTKFLSFNIGAGYNFYKVARDETDFSFNREISGDYTFHTTVGNIDMPASTLTQGYDSNSDDVINARYSYTSQIDFVNIPLEIQAHYINRKKFRMWSGLGVNGSYALSQNTHFSVITEKSVRDYNYSQVYIQRTNAYMTLSVGCDIKFRDKMYIYISPSYRYGLTNLSRGTGVNFRPQLITGVIGIKFIMK